MWYHVRFQLHLLDMIVVIATCFVEINTSFDMMMHHSVDDFVFCFDSCIIDFSFNLSFKPRLYPRGHMKNDFQMFSEAVESCFQTLLCVSVPLDDPISASLPHLFTSRPVAFNVRDEAESPLMLEGKPLKLPLSFCQDKVLNVIFLR